ncbi:hypothetical protein BST61_g152 [Cercospora zeina]
MRSATSNRAYTQVLRGGWRNGSALVFGSKSPKVEGSSPLLLVTVHMPLQYQDEHGHPFEDLPIDKYADIENLVCTSHNAVARPASSAECGILEAQLWCISLSKKIKSSDSEETGFTKHIPDFHGRRFPSFQNQMLSVMTGDRLYEQFEPYDGQTQAFRRFVEYIDKKDWDNKNHFLYHVSEAEKWMADTVVDPTLKWLGIEDAWQIGFANVFVISSNLVALGVLTPLRVVKELSGMFWAKPLRGDAIMGDMASEECDHVSGMMAGSGATTTDVAMPISKTMTMMEWEGVVYEEPPHWQHRSRSVETN